MTHDSFSRPTVHTELRHLLLLILQEAHAWHAQDPDNEPFAVFAHELLQGHLPASEAELYGMLLLYGQALRRQSASASQLPGTLDGQSTVATPSGQRHEKGRPAKGDAAPN